MAPESRIDELRRRVEADPASIAFAQLAEEYRRAGQLTEAVDTCRAGLALRPEFLSVRVTLGRALLALGQLDEASTELTSVVAASPVGNLAATRALADTRRRQGRLVEALEQYRLALSLAPNNPDLERTVADIADTLAAASTRAAQLRRTRGAATVAALERWLEGLVPHAPTNCLETRHAAVRRAMHAASLDALVVVSLPNIAYLTNFGGSSAIVVLTPDRVVFITDSRYVAAVTETAQSAHACPDFDLVVVEGSYNVTLANWLGKAGLRRVGFEAAHLTVSRFRWLESTLASASRVPELVAVDGLIEIARCVKDEYEIAVLRRGGAMLSDVTRQVLGFARAGVSESDMALEIDTAIRRAGFEKPAFETIVASGPNAALPHARPTSRKLSEGDLVVLDFGGVYDSYCVDLTRTVAVGSASARHREVHDAVRVAHDLAIQASGPGQSRFAIDAAARDSLTAAGMGAAFGHGTGHGLGLEIHEDPKITRRGPAVDASREAVTPGMVFTIEPGAYFPGWGGVRIEDDVLVTESGVEPLTNAPTELIVV